jgi:hypothetical protein
MHVITAQFMQFSIYKAIITAQTRFKHRGTFDPSKTREGMDKDILTISTYTTYRLLDGAFGEIAERAASKPQTLVSVNMF